MKIAVVWRTKTTDRFIRSVIKALQRLGLTVVGLANPSLGTLVKASPDFCLTTSPDLKNLFHAKEEFLLEKAGIPYATLWFQTPLRNLPVLQTLTSSLHRGMFIPDSTDVRKLAALGIRNAYFLPISWWVDPARYKPMPPVEKYAHPLAWDCTFMPLKNFLVRIEKVYAESPLSSLIRQAAETFLKRRGEYIDIFDFLQGACDFSPWSEEFMRLYDELFILQKSVEREHVLSLVQRAGLELHIYGGFCFDHNRVNYNHTIVPPPGVTIHDYIDTFTELPKLYASSTILLSRMMYPSGVHDRLFCAAATKGFVLSEWKDDAARAFEPGKEIIMYRDTGELPDLIRYYLAHDGERRKIAEAAHRRFLAEHTPLHRAREFMNTVKDLV
ncbi:MAG: glycosyltransferase [Thermodesulfovibrionales bacterium]